MTKEAVLFGDPEKWTSSYSPAILVKNGQYLYISGQISVDSDGNVVGANDIEVQARKIFDNIRVLLEKSGMDFLNVIKTNYYITDVKQFSKVANMRTDYFSDIFPASTMVEVKGLVREELLLEIEAVAFLPD
jgi:reactive intermediate/imine deaminase